MGWTLTSTEALKQAVSELRFAVARRIGVHSGMTMLEAGCREGWFTIGLAKIVGESGRVLSVDVSTKYISVFRRNLKKLNVEHRVTFLQGDMADVHGIVGDEFADMAVGYRFLEELKVPSDMPKTVNEMARAVKAKGRVCIIELNRIARNKAEENYIRLHKESGDSFFGPSQIHKAVNAARLSNIDTETFDTDVWFSPNLQKKDLGFAQVWFDKKVEKTLGASIEKYGMKYPQMLVFSGTKQRGAIR